MFKAGDKVKKAWRNSVGTIIEVIITADESGNEFYVYDVKFPECPHEHGYFLEQDLEPVIMADSSSAIKSNV